MDWDLFWYLGFIVFGFLLLDVIVIRPYIRKIRKGLVTEDMLKKALQDLEMRLREQNTDAADDHEKTP